MALPRHCFSLSLRDVETILAARGIAVSYESIRGWGLRFGRLFAHALKRRRPRPDARCIAQLLRMGWFRPVCRKSVPSQEARALLHDAANALLTRGTRFSTLKRWAVDVAKHRGVRRAKVALARKLATVLHRIWADGTGFRWSKDAAAMAAATA